MALKHLSPLALLRLWNAVEETLHGVGDRPSGQWRETLGRSVHLKRRLAFSEWGDRPWGMDYRGTPEGEQMLDEVREWLPRGYCE